MSVTFNTAAQPYGSHALNKILVSWLQSNQKWSINRHVSKRKYAIAGNWHWVQLQQGTFHTTRSKCLQWVSQNKAFNPTAFTCWIQYSFHTHKWIRHFDISVLHSVQAGQVKGHCCQTRFVYRFVGRHIVAYKSTKSCQNSMLSGLLLSQDTA
jgi:hypothetical protein